MRVALYARVSTEEQAIHGLSIDAQLAALDEWAKDKTVIDHYVDLGISARKPITKRPELQRLLRDVEQGRIDLVAFCKLDRWTRNIREYYKAQDVLDAHNVAWRAIQEDYETETAAGRLKVNIMLAVAQDEADRASERIKAVFERKREKGLIPGGLAPMGYTKENGKLILQDPELIRQIYSTYISTRSSAETARRFGMTRSGVIYLLRNPANKWVEGYDLAQEIVSQRAQRYVRTDRVFLFSGLLSCPYCGFNLCSAQSRGYMYYRCQKRYNGSCKGFTVSEKKVEAELLNHLIPKVDAVNISVSQKQKKKVDPDALKKKQDKLTDLYMEDLITKEMYKAEFQALQTQIEEALRQPKPIDPYEVKSLLEAYDDWSPQAKKAFWSNLVKSIQVTEEGIDFTLNYT